ncbi:hypothetical protein Tco_1025286 [Tanacetum coccineum]
MTQKGTHGFTLFKTIFFKAASEASGRGDNDGDDDAKWNWCKTMIGGGIGGWLRLVVVVVGGGGGGWW